MQVINYNLYVIPTRIILLERDKELALVNLYKSKLISEGKKKIIVRWRLG